MVNTVQCNTTVVTNDAATAVCIGKTGDDVGGTRCADTRRVDIEDRVVVGLAVLGEDLLDFGVDLFASFLNSGLNHAPAAVWHHCTLQRRIGLQADDDVVIIADVTGLESVDIGGGVGVNIEDADLALLGQVVLFERLPDAQGLFGRPGQEGGISFVRGVVALDEVAHVDCFGPMALDETVPGVGRDVGGLLISHVPSSRLPWLSD